MIIDVHCHYTLSQRRIGSAPRFSFESAAPGGGTHPTDYDSCLSPRAVGRLTWRAARRLAGLPAGGDALDAALERRYAEHLFAPGPVERFVLLAFDAVHDDDGRVMPLPRRRGDLGSDIYSSNSFVRDLCRRHPGRFLFGASVHPYRPGAVACVDEVFAAGASLMKWLPLHQNIDIREPRTLAVLRRCAALGLPVLMHYNQEFTLATHRPGFVSIAPLLDTLRALRASGAMPITILAHAATPVAPWARDDSHTRLLAALAGEFADAPLYADVSALTTPVKVGYLRGLLRRPALHGKLLFGSDFPVPPANWRLRRDLGRSYSAVAREPSWPQRVARLYRALGLSEIALHRAASLLPNVDPVPSTPPSSVPPRGAAHT